MDTDHEVVVFDLAGIHVPLITSRKTEADHGVAKTEVFGFRRIVSSSRWNVNITVAPKEGLKWAKMFTALYNEIVVRGKHYTTLPQEQQNRTLQFFWGHTDYTSR
jgi:hypothetical protein